MSTAFHAKYFAHELTKRCASDSMEKLAASLADAQVDLNPHQVEAALFAFRSPLSKGAILADEVGLGKLPRSFTVRTPVGEYQPDWAIVKHDDDVVYLIRETKGNRNYQKMRTSEAY